MGSFFKRHKRNSSLTTSSHQSIASDKSSVAGGKKEAKNAQVVLNSYKKSNNEFNAYGASASHATGDLGINSIMNRPSGGGSFSPNNSSSVTFSNIQPTGGSGASAPARCNPNPFNICPKLDEVPLIEPLICKRIATERLTSLLFKEDGFVVATQDGFVYSWARPNNNRVGFFFNYNL
jgi:hypothetical protein